ncbi:MAG: hypothetical protein ACRDGJ_00890 [Candidatus Limnocylindria bacterium]
MGPWIVLAALVAAINLFAFIALRGQWGRLVPALAIASLVGTVVGNAVGQRTGLELVRIGDFHVIAASVIAQAAMLVVALLSAIGPVRLDE